MKRLKFILFVCIIAIFLTGCKKEVKLTDDTWYIVDDYGILMLTKATNEETNKDLMIQLKGNGDTLRKAIDTLEKTNQDAKVNNNIGVGYLRLRNFQKAYECFNGALSLAQSDEDKACILSNLSEVMRYMEDLKSAEKYMKEALEIKTNDSLKQLVMESNLESIKLSNETEYQKKIKEIKNLIKREKKLLGSNQFVTIFNYRSLANACYLAGNIRRFEFYMNKALELNKNSYQYVTIDTGLYHSLSWIIMDYDIEKALKYANKNITLLEAWQVRDHYDLLNAYELRGSIYAAMNPPDRDLAIKDFQHVLNQCPPYHSLAAVSYYNIAKTCVYSENKSFVIESYAKAYYLWQLEGGNEMNKDIERELREEYELQNDGNESYDLWFNKQIQKAKLDLKKQWDK